MATKSAEEILIRLRELKPQIIQKFRAKEIQLFGSNVRREQNPESDIDLLVDFEDSADLFHTKEPSRRLTKERGTFVQNVPPQLTFKR